MPGTAVTFLIGAAAIAGLPPLNGFVSEFLIYLASFKGAASLDASNSIPMLAAISGLALIGGLALACFTKAFGIVFLGHPRNEHAAQANEVRLAMLAPGFILAAGCVLIGLLGANRRALDGPGSIQCHRSGIDRHCAKPRGRSQANRPSRLSGSDADCCSHITQYRANSDACPATGIHGRDLGLRLCAALVANAVHGLVIR